MPLPQIITNLFSKGAGNIIESVTNGIDKLTISKEEKEQFKIEAEKEVNRHIEEMAKLQQSELETLLKDADSARNRDIEITTSDKAPILSKLIGPILALSVVALTFILFYLILFRKITTVEKDILVFVLGALTGFVGMILSFYFGSSASSQKKTEQIEKMLNK